jgi:hypothetical protein
MDRHTSIERHGDVPHKGVKGSAIPPLSSLVIPALVVRAYLQFV